MRPPGPLIIGTDVEQHPALGDPHGDLAGLNRWYLIPKHMPTLMPVATPASPQPPDECHRLGNQFPASVVLNRQPNPLLHRLALAGIERQPVTGEISSATRPAGSFTTSRSSTSIAKIDLLILIAFDPNPLPPPARSSPAHAGVLLAERFEQCCVALAAGHELLQQLRQPPIGELLAAGLAGRAVLQRGVGEGHLGDGVSADVTLLALTPMHPQA